MADPSKINGSDFSADICTAAPVCETPSKEKIEQIRIDDFGVCSEDVLNVPKYPFTSMFSPKEILQPKELEVQHKVLRDLSIFGRALNFSECSKKNSPLLESKKINDVIVGQLFFMMKELGNKLEITPELLSKVPGRDITNGPDASDDLAVWIASPAEIPNPEYQKLREEMSKLEKLIADCQNPSVDNKTLRVAIDKIGPFAYEKWRGKATEWVVKRLNTQDKNLKYEVYMELFDKKYPYPVELEEGRISLDELQRKTANISADLTQALQK